MKGRTSLSSPKVTAVAAIAGAALVVAGIVLYGAAVIWSAAEYNAIEAAGNVDLGPSAGVIWLSWIAIALGAFGLVLFLVILLLNLAIALRGRDSRKPEPIAR